MDFQAIKTLLLTEFGTAFPAFVALIGIVLGTVFAVRLVKRVLR